MSNGNNYDGVVEFNLQKCVKMDKVVLETIKRKMKSAEMVACEWICHKDDFTGDIGVFVGFNASLNENNSDGVVVLDLPQSGGKGKKCYWK